MHEKNLILLGALSEAAPPGTGLGWEPYGSALIRTIYPELAAVATPRAGPSKW